MNWPDDLEDIECVGFNSALLPILAEAWENGHVNRHVGAVRRSSTDLSWTFDYLGFQYQIDCEEGSEMREDGRYWSITTPYRLSKIGKLGLNDDGDEFLIEKYPLVITLNHKQEARYQQAWGSF